MVGITQGLGFRPYVWRLAERFRLTGWVQNDSTGLLLEVQGPVSAVEQMIDELKRSPPPLARIDDVEVTELLLNESEDAFVIRESMALDGRSSPVHTRRFGLR